MFEQKSNYIVIFIYRSDIWHKSKRTLNGLYCSLSIKKILKRKVQNKAKQLAIAAEISKCFTSEEYYSRLM